MGAGNPMRIQQMMDVERSYRANTIAASVLEVSALPLKPQKEISMTRTSDGTSTAC
jgi:hypothetical protein